MRTFPFGLPKVLISTMASGMTKPFVGTKDIVMLNSVCDVAGLNTVTRRVFENGALALLDGPDGYILHALRQAHGDHDHPDHRQVLQQGSRGSRGSRDVRSWSFTPRGPADRPWIR